MLFPQFAVEKGAFFSPCRRWRYSLWRIWDRKKPYLAVIGLNPSTADERKNDPTVARCVKFAQKWGYGGLFMLNLFGFRATDPDDMKKEEEPIGRQNTSTIVKVAKKAGLVLAAWGFHGGFLNRDIVVLQRLKDADVEVMCLGRTKSGYPRHPLYIKGKTRPKRYKRRSLA